jgi:pimeloyl-[acyl-carrier protein] methyl ester esterase
MHLLLLPGLDGTGRLFAPLLKVLPASLSPVVVSYPADKVYGYTELLSFVEAAVPAGTAFVVLGESFSGPLALRLAARRPPGLHGVILCASFSRNPLPAFARWLRALIVPTWFRLLPRRLLQWALLGRFRTAALAAMVDAVIGEVQPEVLAARAREILAMDVSAELQSCHVPVLYLSASEDRIVRPRSLAYIRLQNPAVGTAILVGPHLILQVAADAAAHVIESFAAACDSKPLQMQQ